MDVIRAIDDGNDAAVAKDFSGVELRGGAGSVDDVLLEPIPWTAERRTDAKAQAELRHLLGVVSRESLALGMPMPAHPIARHNLLRAAMLGVRPCAAIFDRDETIVVDVPFNGDPDRVEAAPTRAPYSINFVLPDCLWRS